MEAVGCSSIDETKFQTTPRSRCNSGHGFQRPDCRRTASASIVTHGFARVWLVPLQDGPLEVDITASPPRTNSTPISSIAAGEPFAPPSGQRQCNRHSTRSWIRSCQAKRRFACAAQRQHERGNSRKEWTVADRRTAAAGSGPYRRGRSWIQTTNHSGWAHRVSRCRLVTPVVHIIARLEVLRGVPPSHF
jgi:hypothetical protein